MKKILLLILTIIAFQSNVFSQSCNQLFPVGDVQSMTQNGNDIWLGTSNNGLVKFDKTTMTSQNFDTLNSNLTSNIIEATYWHNNKLYVSTDSELMYFDNGNFTLVNDTIDGLLIESANGELVVIDAGMVYFLQNDQIVAQKDLTTIPNVRPECCYFNTEVTVDVSGNLWISRYAFYEFDILKFDGTNWTSFHSQNTAALPIESYMFNGISSSQNTIFATTYGHIHRYEQGVWTNFVNFSTDIISDGQDTLQEVVSTVYYENQDKLWVGTDGNAHLGNGQLFYHDFQNNAWHSIPLIDSLPFTIRKIQTDNSNIFVGTSRGLEVLDNICYVVSTNSVKPKNPTIAISPNPNNGQFTLTYNIGDFYEIYNLQGQMIKNGVLNNDNQKEFTDYHLPKGIYLLRVRGKNESAVIEFVVD